jgi:hypothetical protein
LTGPSPVDRGKKGSKMHVLSDAQGIPLVVAVSGANLHDSQAFKTLILAIPAVRSRRGPRRRRPVKVRADKAYFSADHLAWLRSRGLIPRIARPGIESGERLGRHRWKIERSIACGGGASPRGPRSGGCWPLSTVTPRTGRWVPISTTVMTPRMEAVSGRRRVIAVDGKALKGSARLTAGHRHLLAAVTHHRAVTLAQAEVGAKTNETAHFRPLQEPLDLDGALVTFDALHSVQANVAWLVETTHSISVIKANQPTAYRQLAALPWSDIPVQYTASSTGHGRRESRSIKT